MKKEKTRKIARQETSAGRTADSPANEALRQSEERFRLIYEHAATGVAITDLKGRITQCNPSYCRMLGFTEEELTKLDLPNLIHPDDREENLNLFRRLRAGEVESFEIENRYVAKNGAPVWVHKSVSLLRNAAGEPTHVFALVTNIVRRRHAEEQIERGFSTLQLLVNSVPAFVSYVDADQRYRLVNRQYADYFRMPAEKFVGKRLREVQSPEAYAEMEPHVRAALAGEGVHYQSNPPGPNGRSHWFDVQYIPRTENDGSVSGFFVLVFDITGRKKAEEEIQRAKSSAEAANRAKDHFLAFLGHELRNPLAPIRHSVAILNHAGPPEPVLIRARDVIERQVTHMSRLIDDLLDASRLAMGKIVLRKEVVNLVEKMKTVIEDHRDELDAAGIELEFQPPRDPIWLLGDEVRLAQIVGNLLSNAVKFTDRGGRVTIKLGVTSEMQATLSVCDTGIGMDAAAMAYIFKPFAQAERSIERSHEGLGLGLALVHGLVELHGGSVRASSPGVGKGAEFVVTLPALMKAPAVKPQMPTETPAAPSRRVLIIEDNVDAAETLRALLELHGHFVHVAHTGGDGLQLARAHRPEVLLCDIGLPHGMDGYDVARTIRADAELRPAFLVAMTGFGQNQDRERAKDAGFDRHLTKPADTAELLRILAG